MGHPPKDGKPFAMIYMMKSTFSIQTILMMVFLFLSACGLVPETTPPPKAAPVKRIAVQPRTDNQYYHYTEAQLHSKSGKLDQAIFHMSQAINQDPTSAFLKKELARLYLHQKNRSQALVLLEETLKNHRPTFKL